MKPSHEPVPDRCIVTGVRPLLTELRDAVEVRIHTPGDSEREAVESFVRQAFRQAFDASIRSFYPQLAAFRCHGRLCAVAGFRDGMERPLFSEQYLDEPAEAVMARCLDHDVARHQVVEVGNLALAAGGEARWVIAAMTLLLHAAGYRWVLFTAVRPVFNAFARLGLRPIPVAIPDPARLHDRDTDWGSYYQARPLVYAGNIEAGYRKLADHINRNQNRLHTLMQTARRLGRQSRRAGACTQRRTG